jgi:hypothetical protein
MQGTRDTGLYCIFSFTGIPGRCKRNDGEPGERFDQPRQAHQEREIVRSQTVCEPYWTC